MAKKIDYIPIFTDTDVNHKYYNVNGQQEISISLFGECNMKCDFCITSQRRNKACIDTIQKIKHDVIRIICTNPKHRFQICVYGGELMHDGITDQIFDQYFDLIHSIKIVADKCHKDVQFNIGTNCVHTKRDRVLKLLNDLNIDQLYTSFDFVGRFKSTKQVDRFVDNVNWYKDHDINVNISFIASSDNINVLMNDTSNKLVEIFNRLYQNFTIMFDYCYPTETIQKVSEKEMTRFVIWLYDHYPNIITLQDIINGEGTCDCPAIFIAEDNITYQCCDFKTKAVQYSQLKRCDQCDYNLQCGRHCIRLYNDDSSCFVKALRDYISDREQN